MCYGQILESGLRKTRKQRKCDECRKVIEVGDLRQHVVQLDGKDFVKGDYHLRCYALGVEAAHIVGDSCFDDARGVWREENVKGYWRELRKTLRRSIDNARSRRLVAGKGEK